MFSLSLTLKRCGLVFHTLQLYTKSCPLSLSIYNPELRVVIYYTSSHVDVVAILYTPTVEATIQSTGAKYEKHTQMVGV